MPTLPSGLIYTDNEVGAGAEAVAGKSVSVHYTGWLQEPGGHEPFYQLADDIFLYAVDQKNLKEKGKTYLVDPDPAIKADRTIKVARLQYEGNWDPEPAGWRRLAAVRHAPVGKPALTLRVTVSLKPFTGVIVAVYTALPPATTDCDPDAASEKSGGGAVLIV